MFFKEIKMQTYNSFNELVDVTCEPSRCSSHQSVWNAPWKRIDTHIDGRDVCEGHELRVDFRLERFAGDPDDPSLKPIASQEEKAKVYYPLVQGTRAFYGVIPVGCSKFPAEFHGKVLQFDPQKGVVVVATGTGQVLPDGWENIARVTSDGRVL